MFETKEIIDQVLKKEAVLLDVRTDDEWNEDHAKEATHFDLTLLEKGDVPDIPKDKQIYTHCTSGDRGEKARQILRDVGFQNVECIGGLKDWQRMIKM